MKKLFNKYGWLLRVLGIYLVIAIFITVFTFIYYFFRTPFIFIASICIPFIISYFLPQLFQLCLKSSPYRGEYKHKLIEYAKKHGVSLNEIYVRKNKHSNACAVSFANNASVILHSNLLENHPYNEIEAVMSHELGHHKNKDIYLYTTVVSLILSFSTWFYVYLSSSMNNSIWILLLTNLLLTAIFLPIVLAISRWRERTADRYAFNTLNDRTEFANFFERLIDHERKAGVEIKTTISPWMRYFFTHPWIYDRIRYFKK